MQWNLIAVQVCTPTVIYEVKFLILCLLKAWISVFVKELSKILSIFLEGCLSFSCWIVEILALWIPVLCQPYVFKISCHSVAYLFTLLMMSLMNSSSQNNYLIVLKPQAEPPSPFFASHVDPWFSAELMALWNIFRIPLLYLIAEARHISSWRRGHLGEQEVGHCGGS